MYKIILLKGMGDSRGHHVDQKNFENTIKFISSFKHINTICFLVKPNSARLNPGFRYCFKELLSHLNKNTTSNLVFCFTNARSMINKKDLFVRFYTKNISFELNNSIKNFKIITWTGLEHILKINIYLVLSI